MFISVDLPEPDGPTMATITPRCSVRSMSFRTSMRRPPTAWLLQTPSSLIIGLSTTPRRISGSGHLTTAVRRDDLFAFVQAVEHLHVDAVIDADRHHHGRRGAVTLKYPDRVAPVLHPPSEC